MGQAETFANAPIPLGEIPITVTDSGFTILSADSSIAPLLVIRSDGIHVLSYDSETVGDRFTHIPFGGSFGITRPGLPIAEENVILNLAPTPRGVEVSLKGIKARAIPVATFPPRQEEQTVPLEQKIWTKIPISDGLRIMIGDRYRIKVGKDGASYTLHYRSGNDYSPFNNAQGQQIRVSGDTPFSFANNSEATVPLPYDESGSFLGAIIHEGELYVYGRGSIAIELPKQHAWDIPQNNERR